MRSDKRGQNVDPLAFKPTVERCNVEWSGPCPARPSRLAVFPHVCRMKEGHVKSPRTNHRCECGGYHKDRRNDG